MPGPERSRDLLLVLLAVTTGATDASAFERLGNVFASVITGNLVLVGVSLARADGKLLLFSGCALAGYSAGVILGAPRHPEAATDSTWPAAATRRLALVLSLLLVFAVGWELAGSHPGRSVQVLLVVCAGAAMGAQSVAVRRLGQFSTTYLTSTLTGLLEAVVGRRLSAEHLRSLGILAAALLGAAAATLVIAHARSLLPALQLVPVVTVIAVSRRRFGGGSERGRAQEG